MLTHSIFKKDTVHTIDIHIESKQPEQWTDPDLTKEEIEFVQKQLEDVKENSRISKQDPRLKYKDEPFRYGIIKNNRDYFFVNKGVKHKKELGRGKYGKTKLTKKISETEKNRFYALKVHRKKLKDVDVEHLAKREHEVLTLLHRSHGALVYRDESINIIMDYQQGMNLKDMLLREQTKTEKKLSKLRYYDIIINILKETIALHNLGFLHCDLKPENIIVDLINNRLKLIDFGLSLKMKKQKMVRYKSLRYAEKYRAPEINSAYSKSKTVDYKISMDVFALGVVFQEILGLETIDDTKLVNQLAFEIDPDVTKLLKTMIGPYQTRPRLEDALVFFENKRAQCLKNICVLNIDYYLQNKDKDKKEILEHLSHCDEVYLAAEVKAEMSLESLNAAEIRGELEANNILVANHMYVSNNPVSLKTGIPKLITTHPETQVYFVKSKADLIKIKQDSIKSCTIL